MFTGEVAEETAKIIARELKLEIQHLTIIPET
jgi:hypothetical protein